MRVAGHDQVVDYSKLGTGLLIAACVVLAVRTARWPAMHDGKTSERDLDVEVEHAIHLARRVLDKLLSHQAGMFPQRNQPWYEPTGEDQPK